MTFIFNRIFLGCVFILLVNSVAAKTLQHPDTARYKCAYQFNWLQDTLQMTEGRPDFYILETGKNSSKGYWYYPFYLDSMEKASGGHRGEYWELTKTAVRENNILLLHPGPFKEKLYKDYNEKRITVTDQLGFQTLIYSDVDSDQNWELQEDTMTIGSYSCQKAVCDFRGRQYEAWFTPEIAIDEGPWKFMGLPGLIVKVYDTQRHYCFEMVGFQAINGLIDSKINPNIRKIEREKLLQMKADGVGDRMVSMKAAEVGIETGPRPVKHWDYLERDYK